MDYVIHFSFDGNYVLIVERRCPFSGVDIHISLVPKVQAIFEICEHLRVQIPIISSSDLDNLRM